MKLSRITGPTNNNIHLHRISSSFSVSFHPTPLICRAEFCVDPIEEWVHVANIHVVGAHGLRKSQIEQERQLQDPIERHDAVDSLGKDVQQRE